MLKKSRKNLKFLDSFAIIFEFLLRTIPSLHRCVGHTAWAPKGVKDVIKQARRAAT